MSKHLYNDPSTKSNRRHLRKNATDAERKLWRILQNRQMSNSKFLRQYTVGSYVLDFYCPERRLAIEVDGGQHADSHSQQHDAHRDKYLKELNIRVIRLWNNDVLQNIDGVGQKIKDEIERLS